MSPVRAAQRDNAWLAQELRELAARLELDDGAYRPRAYRRAAETIEQLHMPIAEVRDEADNNGLERLPGIGSHIAAVICELLDTGKAQQLERLRKKTPVDVMALLAVDGIGSKTLKLLWQKLRVRTLDDLERALDAGRVRALPGFGARKEARLRQAVRIQRGGSQRVPRSKAAPIATRLRAAIASHPAVSECTIAGSLRRGLPTIGDIDLVAASEDPEAVADVLLQHPDVAYVYSRGPQRVNVRLKQGLDVDLRTVAPECYGSALLYFTGNRAHTVALRRLALAEGLRLNEYGLFRGSRRIAGATEQEIYEALALRFVPPGSRRGEAEIRDALRKRVKGRTSPAREPTRKSSDAGKRITAAKRALDET